MGHGLSANCRAEFGGCHDDCRGCHDDCHGCKGLLEQGVPVFWAENSCGSKLPQKAHSKANGSPSTGLLTQLLSVEGNPTAQEKLFSTWKTFGCLIVVVIDFCDPPAAPQTAKAHLPETPEKIKASCCGLRQPSKPGAAPPKDGISAKSLGPDTETEQHTGGDELKDELKRQMLTIGHLRRLMASRVWSEQVRLIKADGPRFFAFSPSVFSSLGAACRISQLLAEFPDWLDVVAPELSSPKLLQSRIGMEAGDMLPLHGDCFGDAATVAVRLGRELARPGELLLGSRCAAAAFENKAMSQLVSCLRLEETIAPDPAGIPLTYYRADVTNLEGLLPPSQGFPCQDDLAESPRVEAANKRVAIFVSDMSGAMRNTRKHGTLHNLRLILSAQSIVAPIVGKHKGHIFKFDGETIVAVFPAPDRALACAEAIWKEVTDYNLARVDQDYQIRMGFVLDFGDLVFRGHDVQGKVLDRATCLAEDATETKEVLITHQFAKKVRAALDDAGTSIRLSDERVVEHPPQWRIRYHGLAFAL